MMFLLLVITNKNRTFIIISPLLLANVTEKSRTFATELCDIHYYYIQSCWH